MNLDDIFGDVMFTPDGDTVFLSEQQEGELLNSGEGANVATMASRAGKDGKFEKVQKGGGLYTTDLVDPSKAALTMGASADGVQPTAAAPYKRTPQAEHHLQYAAPKKKKGSRSSDRKMSEAQKVERR
jgi:hypothetical protein